MNQDIIIETSSSHILLDIPMSISSHLLSVEPINKPFKLPESKLLQQSEFLIFKHKYWENEIIEALEQIHHIRKNKKWTLKRNILTNEKIKATGDNHDIALKVGRNLGISKDKIYSSITPEEKRDLIVYFQSQNETVAMVGDGINDSAALAAANIGIALSTGSNIAMDVAD
ncbi:unnamed protein product, partial [Pneumocystis jirovecii]